MDAQQTYRVKIRFYGNRPPYEKSGVPLRDAIRLKEYFLESVPAAYSGSVTPERKWR